jgi:stage IV sporulation protein FB
VYFAAMLVLCFAAASARRIGLGLLFAAAHEAGHLALLSIFRVKPQRVCLTAAGIRIEAPPGIRLSFGQEIIIALAGPTVSLALAGLFVALQAGFPAQPFFQTALWINLGFGLFNLLPVRQLDGGRVLYYALCKRCTESAARHAALAISLAVLFPLATLAAVQFLRGQGSLSLALAVVYLAVCC